VSPGHGTRARSGGFTLVEMLAAGAVMAILFVVIYGVMQQTGNAWRGTNAKIEAFQDARTAFDAVTRSLSQATLNTYYDYDSEAEPTRYLRKSDLHFRSGRDLAPGLIGHGVFFQATLGYSDKGKFDRLGSLNGLGFYVTFGSEQGRPAFVQTLGGNQPANPKRFRLMQWAQPTQSLAVYEDTAWFADSLGAANPPVHELAKNVIALVILPRAGESSSLTPDYEYDSRAGASANPQPVTAHQLPPLVEVVMVVLDEASAERLGDAPSASDLGLDGLFLDSSSLERLDADLAELERRLAEKRLTWRTFRTTVALPNSKWSRES
jgi:uncharacterized protein (TIGR02599 family)